MTARSRRIASSSASRSVASNRSRRWAASAASGSRAELHVPGAAPEGLVAVVEDRLHRVPLAAEVDVRDVRLALEHRPHQVRQLRIEVDDLLELVEHDRDAALALGGDAAGKLEQMLDRVVDVRAGPARAKREAEVPVVGVELDRRPDPQARGRGRPPDRVPGRQARRGRRGSSSRALPAKRSFVGVRIRSQLRDKDVLPERRLRRRGARGTTSRSAAARREDVLAAADVAEQGSRARSSRSTKASSSARFPKVNGFSLYTAVLYNTINIHSRIIQPGARYLE